MTTTKATRVRRKRKSFEMDSLELCVSILNQVLRDETTPRSLIQSQIDRIGRRIEFLQNPQGGLFREIERPYIRRVSGEGTPEEVHARVRVAIGDLFPL